MTEEARPGPRKPITRYFQLMLQDIHYQLTNYMSTISQGTSIRSQTYTRQIIMNNEAIGLPQTTRPNDKQSRTQ